MVKTRRFCLGTTTLVVGLAAFALPTGVLRAAPSAPASPEHDLCHTEPSREASSLTYLACSLRDGLPPLERETVIVSRPLAEGSPEGARAFATRLTLLLSNATKTRDGGVAVGPSPQSGTAAVLLLEPTIHGILVQVNATLLGKRASVWARVRGETHQVLAHAFASKPIDAELRSYLPALPLVRPTVTTYPSPLPQINAIACGDVDADGALELAIANRRDVAIGALTDRGFVPTRVAALSALSDVAPVPLREPLAALWLNGATLEVSTTDRRDWLALDAALVPVARQPHVWGVAPGLCVGRNASLSREFFDCKSPPKVSEATSTALDRVVVLDDPPERVLSWRDPSTGTLTVKTATRTWTLSDRGAQLSVGDLNRDGTLEVLSTSAGLKREDDKIAVHTLPNTSDEPVLAWELPVPTGVDALAVCPIDGAKQSAIVFASNDYVGVAL